MKRMLLVLIASFIAVLPAFAAPSLDGKTFSGSVMNEGATKPDPDNFIFSNGKFRSTACDQYGYTEASYTAIPKGMDTAFEVTTHNKDGDSITWKGTVSGDTITGSAERKSGDKHFPMTFNGKLKNQG